MEKRHLFANVSSLWLLSTILLLAGCGTMVAYEGPPQPKEKISVIKSPSALKQFAGKALPGIICIDGKKVSGSNSEIEVLPGKHQVEISFLYQPIWGSPVGQKFFVGYLDFEAQAGHEYIVNGDVVNSQPLIWINSNNTQQVVARGIAVDRSFQNYKPCS